MSLFQSIVIEKYVRELDSTQLEVAWKRYANCFLDITKQDNIRLSKEEQYQEGFLRDLFVDIFGYTLNPNPNYNLTTEFKNKTSSKKADGAILKDGYAIGVIELKGMNTTDMSKIEAQAFGYKNNQPKCRYVITSNFQKLRLYIDNAVEYEEFDLFTMSQDRFALLYLLLRQTSMLADLPAKIKSESLSQEEAITKQLYKDYSVFKRELFADLTANNPDIDALILFQKSQKLLDRLLFIFFAEDSHLLPANFAKEIISEWEQWKSLKMTVPLYDRVKAYFGYLDKGHKDDYSEIFAYNGGLFRTDSLLDSVVISDEILRSHILTLSEYDFDSEVDVNILGHIFENSLSELDEVKAQLAGEVIDKSQTKRKKDGVFYTPKYITKYIVENTVGKLCEDKKVALALNEEDYQLDVTLNKSGKKRKKTDKRIAEEKEALDRLHAYREWLLEMTICDPACGSGAFLNEALNFLIAEHEYIVELETKLFGSGLAYPDIENSILENNLFGVDINEESVEIAKLSLWLRTAQPRRKLNNLNDNIQCGNSLIDDPKVAGDKAFNWQTAFPKVFAKGGFDVVIGNPPYGAKLNKVEKEFLKNEFKKTYSGFDTYFFFFEKSIDLIASKGYLGFITPNTFLVVESGTPLRKYLINNTEIESLLETYNIFPDAVVEPITTILKKGGQTTAFNVFLVNRKVKFSGVDEPSTSSSRQELTNIMDKNTTIINYKLDNSSQSILNTVYADCKLMSDVISVKSGVKPYEKGKGTPAQTSETLEKKPYNSSIKSDKSWLPCIRGTNIKRYSTLDIDEFILYGSWLAAPRNKELFSEPKIFMRRTDDNLYSNIDTSGAIGINSVHCIQKLNNNNEFELLKVLSQLNSKLHNWIFRTQNFHMVGKPMAEVKTIYIQRLPYKNFNEIDGKNITVKVRKVIQLNSDQDAFRSKFIRTLQRKFDIDKLSKKLESWHELTYAEFIKELGKKKIKMSLSDEAEWEEYFLAEQTKAKQLIAEIERTDREIDQMVYKLYDLTDDEIATIEAS